MHRTTVAAWEAWLATVVQTRQDRALLKRAVAHIVQRSLAAGWSAWSSWAVGARSCRAKVAKAAARMRLRAAAAVLRQSLARSSRPANSTRVPEDSGLGGSKFLS